MGNRLEELRKYVDDLVKNNDAEKICVYASHMYGVSKFCTLLAKQRNLNMEIAATCGMLHDIGYMTGGSSHNHAIDGANKAQTILKSMNSYNDDEIKLITTAIARHSDKLIIHDSYDELLKDADVMDHCFYNNDFPVAEWEVERYHNLLMTFGINVSK